MRVLLLFILFFISNICYGQKFYHAIYDCSVNNNLKESEAILKQYPSYNTTPSKISYDFIDSSVTKSDNTIPDTAIQNYFIALKKAAINNLSLVFWCSNEIIRKEKLIREQNPINSNTQFTFEQVNATGSSSISFLDLGTMKLIKHTYDELTNKKTVTCYNVDTEGLSFSPTGKTKKINAWFCKEYKCYSDKYNDISVWASTEIPNSITPQVILHNVEGGIVCIEFTNNSSLTLRNLSAINTKVVVPDCDVENVQSYNMFNFYIRSL